MGPAFAKRYGLGSGFKFRNLRKGSRGNGHSKAFRRVVSSRQTLLLRERAASGYRDNAVGRLVPISSGQCASNYIRERQLLRDFAIARMRVKYASSPAGTLAPRESSTPVFTPVPPMMICTSLG